MSTRAKKTAEQKRLRKHKARWKAAALETLRLWGIQTGMKGRLIARTKQSGHNKIGVQLF